MFITYHTVASRSVFEPPVSYIVTLHTVCVHINILVSRWVCQQWIDANLVVHIVKYYIALYCVPLALLILLDDFFSFPLPLIRSLQTITTQILIKHNFYA